MQEVRYGCYIYKLLSYRKCLVPHALAHSLPQESHGMALQQVSDSMQMPMKEVNKLSSKKQRMLGSVTTHIAQ